MDTPIKIDDKNFKVTKSVDVEYNIDRLKSRADTLQGLLDDVNALIQKASDIGVATTPAIQAPLV